MKEKVLQKIFPALGTVNTVTIYGDYDAAILTQAMQRVLELHQLFSIFDPQSEISKINEMAGICPVSICDDTFSVLSLAVAAQKRQAAHRYHCRRDGRLWRDAIRSNRIPTDAQIEEHRLHRNIGALELDDKNRTAFLRQAAFRLIWAA